MHRSPVFSTDFGGRLLSVALGLAEVEPHLSKALTADRKGGHGAGPAVETPVPGA